MTMCTCSISLGTIPSDGTTRVPFFEILPHDSYLAKIYGTGPLSSRNLRFLRKFLHQRLRQELMELGFEIANQIWSQQLVEIKPQYVMIRHSTPSNDESTPTFQFCLAPFCSAMLDDNVCQQPQYYSPTSWSLLPSASERGSVPPPHQTRPRRAPPRKYKP